MCETTEYFGKTLIRRSVAGVQITESAYRAGETLPMHAHEGATLCFTLRGGFTERMSGRDFASPAGALIFRPAGHPHTDRFETDRVTTLGLDLPPEFVAYAPENPVAISKPKAKTLFRKLHRECTGWDGCSNLSIEALLHQIHLELTSAPDQDGARPPKWLRSIRDSLHEEVGPPPALTDLAQLAGVHPMHLTRSFQRFYRQSIGEYVRMLRIERCCRLLRESDWSLGEIGLDAGFCDQAHFSRVFRAAKGMSPSEYRESVNRL